MCVIALALAVSPGRPLVLAANRDELHDRPADPLGWWADAPQVCGGRDRLAGGTWMGLSRGGRFAALTNLRDARWPVPAAARSRGDLVADYLLERCEASAGPAEAEAEADAGGADAAQRYAGRVAARTDRYAGFNLLVGGLRPGTPWWWVGSAGTAPRPIEPGVHGLSNGALNDDWPKVRRLRQAVHEAATAPDGAAGEAALFAVLASTAVPADAHLPDTGVGLERERLLAPLYVRAAGYGTRCSTVLRVAASGRVRVVERTWPSGEPAGWVERAIEFRLD